ncbi:MAG: methyl-accepting chemotaxis protein [Hyphomicrobiales bacterium]
MKFKLSAKMPAMIVGAAMFVGLGIGTVSFFTAKSTIETLTAERLASSATAMSNELGHYLHGIQTDVTLTATSPFTVKAVQEFSEAWNVWSVLGGNPEELLQKSYIEDNPHPLGEKHLLEEAGSGSHYDKVHKTYHPWYTDLMESHGYYDIFLFNEDGNLIYSVFKEADYATNFKKDGGKWAATDLGEVFRRGFAAPDDNPIVFEDFAPYGPSANAPASFIAHGVNDENGKRIGVLAFQMPVDRLNELFSEVSGIGETGEVALVGPDGMLRNDSTSTKANDILKTKVELPFIPAGDLKSTVSGSATAYRSELMNLSVVPLNFGGVNYRVIAMLAQSEMIQPVYSMRDRMLTIGSGLLLIVAIAGLFLGRVLTAPITRLVNQMRELAGGSNDIQLLFTTRSDEVGDIARTAQIFQENAIERARLENDASASQMAREEREQRIERLINDFKGNVAKALTRVSENTEGVATTATDLLKVADGASEQAVSASSSSEEASANVSSVASSATQLNNSINAIGDTIVTTTGIVNKATTAAQDTNQRVKDLADSASRIGAVIALIQDIAEQTNLLALNATIEAARAGDAGRGFAVVASEVKSLASQTAKATDDITTQINEIQSSTKGAAEAIEWIASIMGDVDSQVTTISTSVDEQAAATQAISDNVGQAAIGTSDVSQTMISLDEATRKTRESVVKVNSAVETVNQETDELNRTIEAFLADVAAA